MKLFYFLLVLVVGLLSVPGPSAAQDIPEEINYQGRLTDDAGNPVADGTYSMKFTIYAEPDGLTVIWESGTMQVTVYDGLFNVILDNIDGSVFELTGIYPYLGIKVGTDPEIRPLTKFTTVPYAYSAENAYNGGGWIQEAGGQIIHTSGANRKVGINNSNPWHTLTIGDNLAYEDGDFISIANPDFSTGLFFGEDAQNRSYLVWNVPNNLVRWSTISGGYYYPGLTLYRNRLAIGLSSDLPTENLVIGNNIGSYTGNRVVIGDTEPGVSTGLVIGEDDDSRGWLLWNVDDNYIDIGTKEAGTSYGNTMTIRSDQVGINTTSPNYTLDVRGTIGNNTTLYHSDKRWKQNIRNLNGSLDRVMKLQGVQYNWKQDEYPEMNFPDGEQIGLIAQDVEKIIPEIVNESADGFKSIEYAKLVSVLIESIKEQQVQIEKLSKRVEELEGVDISGK